jgi:phosphoglycerol transferase MdoB-like AlkP superfamily enzyme
MDLDAALERFARGAASPPRHIFLVILESYSAWPLQPRYRPLGITGEMSRLGSRGVLLTDFLPAGDGTMVSVAPLMTGLPNCGIPINYQPESRRPYPTGAASIFSRLGYRTRFFYGGYLSWERIGDFARDQGFDEVWGGGNMGTWVTGNEWGVNDRELYDFVLATIRDDRPSFNIILTVSNHPPYDIDPWQEGFPLRELPPDAAALGDGSFTLKEMGHFWYGDRQFGGFVDRLEKKLPGVLVAATSDHYGRRFITSRPGLVDQSTVPLLLYGPDLPLPASTGRSWGSHLDILPTLVELTAPAAFVYPAFGASLLDPAPGAVSFGSGHAVGNGFVADLWGRRTWEASPAGPPAETPDLESLRRIDNDLKGLSWWRVRHGPDLASPAAMRYHAAGKPTARRRP